MDSSQHCCADMHLAVTRYTLMKPIFNLKLLGKLQLGALLEDGAQPHLIPQPGPSTSCGKAAMQPQAPEHLSSSRGRTSSCMGQPTGDPQGYLRTGVPLW